MHLIQESELIINNRGGIYHLDLRPEELAQTIIIVGDPARVYEVSKHFDEIEFKRQHREFLTHTGYIGIKRISVISTGIGTDNIDIVLNEIDALANIDFNSRTVKPQLTSFYLIRIGTCGSLQQDIPVDAYITSTHGLGIDNLLNYYNLPYNNEEKNILQQFMAHTQLNSQVSQPYIAAASTSILKHFVNGFHQGITVTCPGFYGPQGRVLRLGLNNPELITRLTQFQFGNHRITNFEMETSAIYGLGKLLGHQCISLSVVIANRIHKQFSKDINVRVQNLIQSVCETIETL